LISLLQLIFQTIQLIIQARSLRCITDMLTVWPHTTRTLCWTESAEWYL